MPISHAKFQAQGGQPLGILVGLVSGALATVPMTLAMKALHSQLPRRERYPLPPAEITAKLSEDTQMTEKRDAPSQLALTLAAHFGYGAAAGGVYAPLAQRLPGHPLAKGIGFGLTVWAVSYLGLLPSLGILTPATEHPARRNALMIAVHVVWGTVLGLSFESLNQRVNQGEFAEAFVPPPRSSERKDIAHKGINWG
ncbi:MAG: DUF6789 family protein [Candidatus Sericytochromatia bacterium]